MSELPDSTIEPATDPAVAADTGATSAGGLRHITVERDDIAVCTMYPRDVDETEAASKWIAATGDAFVSLPARR